MGSKKRWSRYRPPAERRTETGTPVVPDRSPGSTPRPSPKPGSKSGVKAGAKAGAKGTPKPWMRPAVVTGIVGVVVMVIVLAIRAAGDDDLAREVRVDLLDVDFISDSLAAARKEQGEAPAVAVHLDEYGMTVEYFDPVRDQTRYVETNSYSEDITVRITDNFYTDYKPQPFDLAVVDPAAMVRAVEDALDDSEDPYSWEVRISVEEGGTTPVMVTRVSADERLERTTAP